MRAPPPWFVFAILALVCACNDASEDTDIPYGFACNPEPNVSDLDGDGFKYPTDCDDGDPAVYPNAQELCNGIDDNCNDRVDEYTSRMQSYAVVGREEATPQWIPFTSGGQSRDPVTFPVQLTSGDEIAAALMADLDGDEIQEVVLQSLHEGWVAAYTIDCDDSFDRRELFEVDDGHLLRAFGDIDGDGDVDLTTFGLAHFTGVVWSNDGDGNFTRRSEEVDWSNLSSMTVEAVIADSQIMMDVDSDGYDDWVMCYAQYGKTYCYMAAGKSDGFMKNASGLVTLTEVQSSSVTLGYFDDDDTVDLLAGLHAPGPDDPIGVYLVAGDGEGFEDDPEMLFDLAWQTEGVALGFTAEKLGNGWMRTVDLDQTDDTNSEILVLLEVTDAVDHEEGLALVFIPDPLAVNFESGFQDGEIRPVEREVIPYTSSLDPSVSPVVLSGVAIQ
jgi:hypothetical protein